MPKNTAQVIHPALVRMRHESVNSHRIQDAVMAAVASTHYGDDTDDAKHYLVIVGDCAQVAKKIFPDASIHIDPQLVMRNMRNEEDVCLLAFCDLDHLQVAHSGLRTLQVAKNSSFWHVEYKHVSAREMAEA